MLQGILLLLHLLAATVWTGGHLVLALTILPRVLKEKSPSDLLRFESAYERIGIPALLIQVVTGCWLAYGMLPDVGAWFNFDNPVSRLITFKLSLLLITLLLAVDARFRAHRVGAGTARGVGDRRDRCRTGGLRAGRGRRASPSRS